MYVRIAQFRRVHDATRFRMTDASTVCTLCIGTLMLCYIDLNRITFEAVMLTLQHVMLVTTSLL